MLRLRNAADSANLAVFTSDGRLGIKADPAAGIELDVTGESALRGDVTLHNAALLIDQFNGVNVPFRVECDLSTLGSNVIEVYDNNAPAMIAYLDGGSGGWNCPAFSIIVSPTILTTITSSATTSRSHAIENASGALIVAAGTSTFTGARLVSGAWTFTGASILEVSAAADVRFRDGTDSAKLRFWDISSQTTSTSRIAGMHDSTGYLVQSGYEAVAAAGTVTAGVLGKHDSTGNTGSVGATTIGNTLPAGMYRVSWYVKITTAGDAEATDSLLVTVAWNDGGAQSRTAIPQNETVAAAIDGTMPVNNLNRAFSGDFVIYSAASQNVSVATTLVNAGATNPEYTFRARLEAI